jgi:hypothetical protein
MTALPEHTVQALCEAVQAVAPISARLTPERWGIRIDVADGGGRGVEYSWYVDSDDQLAAFAVGVLEALQVEVIEFETHTGWPPVDPSDPLARQRGSELPRPDAEVVGGELRCWFGDSESPALRVPPVSVTLGSPDTTR